MSYGYYIAVFGCEEKAIHGGFFAIYVV